MSGTRVIKKYPNRRLYDTEISSYVTIEDVRQLVIEQVDFQIVDARSKEDITRSILLQIILEQEEDGEPIFSQAVLSQIIRFYGDTLQGSLASYLEQSCQAFVDQQNLLREQLESMMSTDPLSYVRDVTQKNVALWQEMQQSFFRAANPLARVSETKAEAPSEAEVEVEEKAEDKAEKKAESGAEPAARRPRGKKND